MGNLASIPTCLMGNILPSISASHARAEGVLKGAGVNASRSPYIMCLLAQARWAVTRSLNLAIRYLIKAQSAEDPASVAAAGWPIR
jgi:hypothetical protein